MQLETRSASETEAAGAQLARRLVPGDVVVVCGELGSGKTVFVRGALRALGVTDVVTSPTFTIGQLYHGRVEIAHVDLYRLSSPDQQDEGLLYDYLTPDRIGFVEWPEPFPGLSDTATARVRIDHAGGERRLVTIG